MLNYLDRVDPQAAAVARVRYGFDASLPNQFDEWIWFDETSAVRPLTTQQSAAHEPPHPFAIIDE